MSARPFLSACPVAGVEAGGTKFVCGVGTGPSDLKAVSIATRDPKATLNDVCEWLRRAGPIAAVGIGSFGPVDLGAGRITTTPKPGWRDFGLAAAIREALGVPVAFETDVAAALAGEARWGAAAGVANCIYMTVGTGIGAAAIIGGRRLEGASHPEMGHIRIPHDVSRDPFRGSCPYHGDCLEGLASGPAIQARWGAPGELLDSEHAAWALESEYLALGIANLASVLRPGRVLLGGGVMKRAELFEALRVRVSELLGGYIELPEICPAALGANAGVLGAISIATDLVAGRPD